MAAKLEPEFYCHNCEQKTLKTRQGYNCEWCGSGFLEEVDSMKEEIPKFDNAVSTTSRSLLPSVDYGRTRKNPFDQTVGAAGAAGAAAQESSFQPSTSRRVNQPAYNEELFEIEPNLGLQEIFEPSAGPSTSSGVRLQEDGADFCSRCNKEQQMTPNHTCKACGSENIHVCELNQSWNHYPIVHPELCQESPLSSLESNRSVDPESPDEDSMGTRADMAR